MEIVAFCEKEIEIQLQRVAFIDHEIRITAVSSCEECQKVVLLEKPQGLILQFLGKAYEMQDLLWNLQVADYYPAILMFEHLEENDLRYVVSEPEAFPLMERLEKLFTNALQDRYKCRLTYIRTMVTEDNQIEYLHKQARIEALKELIRGVMGNEYRGIQKRYGFDFRGKGYYLFFWNLFSIEYTGHRYYKNIFNLIGEKLQTECEEILCTYNGGEVFYLDLLQLCVIINHKPCVSRSDEEQQRNMMLNRLGKAAGCRTAIRYLSRKIESPVDFRVAYEGYVRNRELAFFMRNNRIMREEIVDRVRVRTTVYDVQPVIKVIADYLRYDIENEQLLPLVSHLYMNIIKSAMSYTLYHFCAALIYAELSRHMEVTKSSLADAASGKPYIMQNGQYRDPLDMMSLNSDALRFSSIEDEYEKVRQLIADFQLRYASRHNSKRTLLLRAIEYIEENYDQDITVADIANALYISKVYISQIFHNEMKMGAMQYLIGFRIEKAKQLISGSDTAICFVAEQVGFSDSRHFSKTFKKITGQTPTEFRKSAWTMKRDNQE